MEILRPEETRKKSVEAIISELSHKELITFSIKTLSVKEGGNTTEVSCSYEERRGENQKKNKKIKKTSNGTVGSIFEGLMSEYSEEFPMLKNLRFHGFSVKADVNTGKSSSGADSKALVMLEICSSSGRVMTFRANGRSVNASMARVVFDAYQFYINCSMTFESIREMISEARSRNREDIASSYVSKLVQIVNIVPYEVDCGY